MIFLLNVFADHSQCATAMRVYTASCVTCLCWAGRATLSSASNPHGTRMLACLPEVSMKISIPWISPTSHNCAQESKLQAGSITYRRNQISISRAQRVPSTLAYITRPHPYLPITPQYIWEDLHQSQMKSKARTAQVYNSWPPQLDAWVHNRPIKSIFATPVPHTVSRHSIISITLLFLLYEFSRGLFMPR
jgi:hypothetical protein